MTVYELKIAKKPKTHPNGKPVNPADLPALNRYAAVRRIMRTTGATEQEAIDQYDRERGKCTMCGGSCMESRWFCDECKRKRAAASTRRYREEHKDEIGLSEKVCTIPGCGTKFVGKPGRTNCDTHRGMHPPGSAKPGRKPKAGPGERHATAIRQPKPPRVKPATWEKPLPKAKLAVPKHEPVDPKGHRITVVPTRPELQSLRDLFGTGRNAAD